MEWNDIGVVLSTKRHGENSIILSLLTEEHGRYLGLVRGSRNKKSQGTYEPGNLLSVKWRARISDHLGGFTCELIKAQAALYLNNPLKLSALIAACSLAEVTLPERSSEPIVFRGFCEFLESLVGNDWPRFLVIWELNLLKELGFGLDLSKCASTGQTSELVFVSPKTGRSVSRNAGLPFAKRLLPLPEFLLNKHSEKPNWSEIIDGLTLTSYFLENHLLAPGYRKLPNARYRLIEKIQKFHL